MLEHPADEFVVDLLLDEEPRAGAANLAGIGKYRHRRTGHRRIEIGIGGLQPHLGADQSRVNVKASSPEGIGALGRGDGMAAAAIVMLEAD